MKQRLAAWLRRLEHHIVDRRDSTSSLVLVMATLPVLWLLFLLQWLGTRFDEVALLYRRDWLNLSLVLQLALIGWLSLLGWLAWRRRDDEAPLPWLVQSVTVSCVLGVVALSLAYGLKDTPMATVTLAELVFARALFPLKRLRWAFVLGLLLVLGCEYAMAQGWLRYAPLVNAPVYLGKALHAWWSFWVRVVFDAGALPLSGTLFFLASSLNRHRRELMMLVRTDMLTGLSNRREFMTRLERESHRQARSGRPLSVVLFDVDHFKRVNDTWGHPVGDEVLARVGEILRSHTREQVDTAARYGGEEFVLLLPETDLSGARHVAEKICARLREHAFKVNGQSFKVTQSVGIAQVVEGDIGWALQVADRNLYQAKREGRDRIVASVAFAESLQPA